jgi:ABC-type branched-subunit amino acid transport system ATPase component
MLTLENIKTAYGKIGVLWGVSLQVDKNEIVALVGANGAYHHRPDTVQCRVYRISE